jgi:hypothetical protein
MTVKSHQLKYVAKLNIMTWLIVSMTAAIMGNVYADHCSASNHCYAGFSRTVTNDGNKYTVTVTNLTIPNTCGVGTTEFTAIPNWILLNSMGTDWIEVGFAEGKIAGNCYSEVLYTFTSVDGGSGGTGFGTHGTLTVGNTYTLSIDDGTVAKRWDIRKDTTIIRQLSTSYNTGYGRVGGEITHNSATSVPLTHLTAVSYYSGGWNQWATSPNSAPEHVLDGIICTNYHHIHIKSGTATC